MTLFRLRLVQWLFVVGALGISCSFDPKSPSGRMKCTSPASKCATEGFICTEFPQTGSGTFFCCKDVNCKGDDAIGGILLPDGGVADAKGGIGSGGSGAGGSGGATGMMMVDAGTNPMVCPVPTLCAVGARRCGINGGVEACGTGATGCAAWGPEMPCPGAQRCKVAGADVVCACPDAPTACAGQNSGAFCDGAKANVIRCTMDAQGCVTSTTMSCPSGKPCEGIYPTARCSSCPLAPSGCNGSSSGSYCSSASTVATCAGDANGCVFSTSSACANGCAGSHPAALCCATTCSGKCGGPDGCNGTCPNTCVGPQTCGGGGVVNVCGLRQIDAGPDTRLPNDGPDTRLPNDGPDTGSSP